MAAWITGGLGTVLVVGLASLRFQIPIATSLVWVGISNLVALVAVLWTLRLEKIGWLKRTLLFGSLKTWAFFVTVYFGFLLGLIPPLREWNLLLWMVMPLVMSTGLMLNPLFGPIQDALVRRSQREARIRAQRMREAKASE